MDQKSELNPSVMVAIDACRHDSGDLGLPEVATVVAGAPSERVADYHRTIERIDRAVAGAMQDLPVPEGLAERILAGDYAQSSTGQSPAAQSSAAGDMCEQELLTRPTETGNKPRRRSRRLVLSGAFLAMAASVMALVLWGMRESLDASDLQAQAKAFYENDDHSAPFSNGASSFAPPVASGTVLGWRPVTFLSRSGAAFELGRMSGRRRVTGTVYVIPLSSFRGPALSGLPTTPAPLSTSAMTVAVWTDGQDVYVMIVKGDQKAFESFFEQKFA
jgi:hypothetical protein